MLFRSGRCSVGVINVLLALVKTAHSSEENWIHRTSEDVSAQHCHRIYGAAGLEDLAGFGVESLDRGWAKGKKSQRVISPSSLDPTTCVPSDENERATTA